MHCCFPMIPPLKFILWLTYSQWKSASLENTLYVPKEPLVDNIVIIITISFLVDATNRQKKVKVNNLHTFSHYCHLKNINSCKHYHRRGVDQVFQTNSIWKYELEVCTFTNLRTIICVINLILSIKITIKSRNKIQIRISRPDPLSHCHNYDFN